MEPRARRLISLAEENLADVERAVAERMKTGPPFRAPSVLAEEEKLGAIRQEVTKWEEDERKLLQSRSKEAQAAARRAILVVSVGSGVGFALLVCGALVLLRDVRRRKAAEEEIKKLAEFVQLNPRPVLEFDRSARLVYSNRAACTMAASLGGERVEEILPERAEEVVRQCLDGEVERLRLERTIGRRVFSWSFYPIESRQAVHCYGGEITELKQAQEELEAFSYSVSHDLRAPLRHIHGFMDLLKRQSFANLDEKSRRYFGIISDAAEQMGNLIDDLLTFSRMGRASMRLVNVDLETMVRAVIQGLGPETEGRTITWEIGKLPNVQADAAMLRQVWVNLIGNAAKYTRPRDNARIEIGCTTESGGDVVCFVRDNGVGFDMQYGDKLFGVFQRLHHADQFEGTGIGLANVRRIISRHGGRTWAEGAVDAGAVFYFSLPQARIGKE